MSLHQLLIATRNQAKLQELRDLLQERPFDLGDLSSFPAIQTVAETGSTFAKNAELKAAGYAEQAGVMTIADDSGLEVQALGGRPGVLSARYAGAGASDSDRVDKLLSELSNVPASNRGAQFVSAVAIANGEGEILNISIGVCTGRIADAPRGANGFGYDPVFIPDGFGETFAELPSNVKNQISHRARALKGAAEFLRSLTL
jgi:XTP/dITP diphosphohydrolase